MLIYIYKHPVLQRSAASCETKVCTMYNGQLQELSEMDPLLQKQTFCCLFATLWKCWPKGRHPVDKKKPPMVVHRRNLPIARFNLESVFQEQWFTKKGRIQHWKLLTSFKQSGIIKLSHNEMTAVVSP